MVLYFLVHKLLALSPCLPAFVTRTLILSLIDKLLHTIYQKHHVSDMKTQPLHSKKAEMHRQTWSNMGGKKAN